jgi:hypothetical protein
MQSFLQEIASDLYQRYGDQLSSLYILFPTRRARHFFMDALSQLVERPMWQPHWLTIEELMQEVSGLHSGERIRMLTELYKIYTRYHAGETFDKFYFWGEMLLTDFDTVDKYLVDADALFHNISDLKEIESDLSYLTEEQLAVIRQFWSNFLGTTTTSDEKQSFLKIWRTLSPIYHDFRVRLQELGIAYGGMIQRIAAEKLRSGAYTFDLKRHFVVAGFNALSACERVLFDHLQRNAPSDFYWDYDDYYVKNAEQEAGMFVRENIVRYPAVAELSHDNFSHIEEMEVISTLSNVAQCKYVSQILNTLRQQHIPLDKQTAIVLTDENLLMPLLYALPEDVGKVNVTMGYPLRSTLSYVFLERLIELQSHCRGEGEQALFYHTDVEGLLSHPYLQREAPQANEELKQRIRKERRIYVAANEFAESPLLAQVFRPAKGWQALSDYLMQVIELVARTPYEGAKQRERVEFLAVIAEHLRKLRNSLDACDVELTPTIYTTLLRHHIQTVSVPFEGEPLEGLQVMGILETRNLDFRNVILLSMNDDNFPGNRISQASFIPLNLRAAFNLPTPTHHEGVYAYYFYRLLQRAEQVFMLYSAHTDDKSTGEQSHYIYQLDFETPIRLHRTYVTVDVNQDEQQPIVIAKEGKVWEQLQRYLDPKQPEYRFSPSSFSAYIACPLRFYFKSIAKLDEERELVDEVDSPMFGTILHAAARDLYERVLTTVHPGELLERLVKERCVEEAVTRAINTEYLKKPNATQMEYSGQLILVHGVISQYLKQILRYDSYHDNFSVMSPEQYISMPVTFCTPDGVQRQVEFGGIADRIDSMDNGRLRVVDYKTGTGDTLFNDVADLFEGEKRTDRSYILQVMLYSMILWHTEQRDATPTLYLVSQMGKLNFTPAIYDKGRNSEVESYAEYTDAFEEQLQEKLSELFDPERPFRESDDVDKNANICKYCNYKLLCRR